jgi:5-(carboxyamino)imidazole ribonucleotide mutase
MIRAAIVMGSASDKDIALEAVETLQSFGVETLVRVLSAHRTPMEAQGFAQALESEGVGVVIAFAGMAAHLAGAIAANTVLPVIGVPVSSGDLGGMDALLSTVQMPSGIPVATVAVNGAKNAALLAIEILALQDMELREKLVNERHSMRDKVLQADEALQKDIQSKQGRV